MDGMNVYDFAPDIDLSKEEEGSIFGVNGVKGIGSAGIEYAKVVVIGVFFMIVIRIKDYYRVVIVCYRRRLEL